MKKALAIELIDAAINFWYNDQGVVRSPFPEYVREATKEEATEKFVKWLNSLNELAKDEIDHEMIADQFEQFLFDSALEKVKTDDEKISILYPFMPRVGDRIAQEATVAAEGNAATEGDKEYSRVTSRNIVADGDTKYLEVQLVKDSHREEEWSTRFELPA